MPAYHQPCLLYCDLEIAALRGQRFFLRFPEWMFGGQKEGRESLGCPISGAGATVSLGQRRKLVGPTQGQGALVLKNGPIQEKLKISSAKAAGLPRRNRRNAAVFREAEWG